VFDKSGKSERTVPLVISTSNMSLDQVSAVVCTTYAMQQATCNMQRCDADHTGAGAAQRGDARGAELLVAE
jgi:hypothetical protein